MHDFCLTIPYALFLLIGGIFGFMKSGSMTSLIAGTYSFYFHKCYCVLGGGTGMLLLFFAKFSLDNYNIVNGNYEEEPDTVWDDGSTTKKVQVVEENGKKKVKLEVPTIIYLFLSAFISLILSVVMSYRYLKTEKIMPPGVIAATSIGMTLFYVYKIVRQPEHVPHMKKA